MNKNLKLIHNIGVFDKNKEYLLTENDNLTITIQKEFGSDTELFAIVGEHRLKVGKTFEIPSEWLKAGELNLVIIARCGNNQVGRYVCTPIIVKEIENKKYVSDEIIEFRKELEAIKNDCVEMKSNIKSELDKVKKLTQGMLGV